MATCQRTCSSSYGYPKAMKKTAKKRSRQNQEKVSLWKTLASETRPGLPDQKSVLGLYFPAFFIFFTDCFLLFFMDLPTSFDVLVRSPYDLGASFAVMQDEQANVALTNRLSIARGNLHSNLFMNNMYFY